MAELETHLIVGAGQAGGCAALAMRQAGFEGRIVLVGDEIHRPYERPPLSKEVLTAAEPPLPYIHAENLYAENAIELALGCPAEGIDIAAHMVRLADGRALSYDRLLLATGGRVRRLSVPGGDRAVYLRTLDDARHLRGRLAGARHVAIIGAGVIGLEVASSARKLGVTTTVIEATGGAMARVLTPEVARFVEELHRAASVELRFGVQVQAIEPVSSDACRILCASAPPLDADLVVAGIGIVPDTALAEAAGIAIEDGILVDEHGRTSAADVYAAGDVARFWHPALRRRLRLEAWQHAQNHGIAVARAMCGVAEPYAEVPWFWTDQHGINLQVAGVPLEADTTVVRGSLADRRFTMFHLAGARLVGATTANQGRDMRPCISLIRSGRAIDAAALGDPAIPLRRLLDNA